MIHSNQVIALAKGRLLGPAGRRLRMAGLACALALLGALLLSARLLDAVIDPLLGRLGGALHGSRDFH